MAALAQLDVWYVGAEIKQVLAVINLLRVTCQTAARGQLIKTTIDWSDWH